MRESFSATAKWLTARLATSRQRAFCTSTGSFRMGFKRGFSTVWKASSAIWSVRERTSLCPFFSPSTNLAGRPQSDGCSVSKLINSDVRTGRVAVSLVRRRELAAGLAHRNAAP